MLVQRLEETRLPMALQSPKLTTAGFVHGFGTRHADVGPEATPDLRAAALERLGASANARLAFAEVEQVHGIEVAHARAGGKHDIKADAVRVDADALLVAGAIRTADCVPILIGNVRSGAVVAVHAGWRGLVSGVIESAILAVGESHSLVCAIGPCIGPGAFEIGEDVAVQFVNKVADQRVIVKKANSLYGDLQLAAQLVLTRMGVPFSAIDRLEHCTFTEAHLFFSYRRDRASATAGTAGGRQLSFIAPHSRSTP